MKKFLSMVLACTLVVSLAAPAFATNEREVWTNSVGSQKDDYKNPDSPVGQDVQQGQQTKYEEHNQGGSQETEVYATRTSTFSVLIPKTVILDGNEKTGTYVISVKGDMGTDAQITIAPASDTFTLTKKDTDKTTDASFVNGAHTFVYNEVNEDGWQTLHEGTINANELTAGSWHGTFNFNIVYTDA